MSAVETRNVARDSLFLFAELVLDGRPEAVKVKVRNLSSGGMMAEGGGVAVSRGDGVVVKLRNVGDVKGTVAWVQGIRFGIAFENQIEPKLARAPAAAAGAEAPLFRPASSGAAFSPEERRLRNL